MGCVDKVLCLGLTCILAYQAVYNLRGAMELGGKYMNTKELLYSVGSLVPAIILGIHASKLSFAKTAEAKQNLAASTLCKIICYLYMALFAGCLVFRVFIHFQYSHQLAPEHVASYEKSRSFLIYYWGVLQYGFAWALTASYWIQIRKVAASAKASEKKESAVKSESLNSFEQPIVSNETVYSNNSIV